MRTLKYELTDGTVVSTLAEAKNSGQEYTVVFDKIVEKPTELSPISKAMMEQFGYVSERLLDKVVL